MRDGDWLIGWGTAATMYPTNIAAVAARVTLYPDGTATGADGDPRDRHRASIPSAR